MSTEELTLPNYEGVNDESASDTGVPNYESVEEGGVIDIDVTNVKDPFEIAPHGNYRLEIKKYALGASKEAKSPMISAVYEIVGPESEHVGKQVFDNMIIQGDGEKFGKWRHKQICEATGLPMSGAPARAFVGKQFDAELSVIPANEQYPAKNGVKTIFK